MGTMGDPSTWPHSHGRPHAPTDLDGDAVKSAPLPSEAGALSDLERAKLLRKIDFYVLPMLFLIYVVAFLDRANISNALTMNMPQELGMEGEQPNTALAIFFVPYILFEIPSNVLMRRYSPHVWLSACMLCFGLVMLGQGFVQGYGGLLATRFLLGFFEAGTFPGSFYLISSWYERQEAQKRFTVYFTSVILASAFGGLLASAINAMDGSRGLSGWRWIFILEGVLSVLVAAVAFFHVSDFPGEAKWLSETEKQFVLAKTSTHEAASEGDITRRDFVAFFRDPKNYFGAIMYFSVVVPVYGFAYFAPTIVRTLGYSVVQTQLHSVPPFAAALGMCLVVAYLSDLTDHRFLYLLFSAALVIAGLSILMTIHGNFSIQYAGICLVCMGAFSAGPVVICWYLMNLAGSKQRAIGSGYMISVGNTGGILAPFAFLPEFAPNYYPGYAMCMGVAVLGVVAVLCYAGLVLRDRRRMLRGGGADTTPMLSL